MTTLDTTHSASHKHDLAWWLILSQGIVSIIIGLLFLLAPNTTILVMVQLLGVYWLVNGVLSLVSISVDRYLWGWKLFSGVIGVLAGIYIIQHPALNAILIPTLIVTLLGIQGIIFGVLYLFQAFKGLGWGTAILGVLSILLGIFLISSPLFVVRWIFIILGVVNLVGGFVSVLFAIIVSRKQILN